MPRVEFYKHNVNENDLEALKQTLKGIFLTTGQVVEDFEKKLANYLKVRYTIGLMSGTHALQLALTYYQIGPGDEVITTPLSYTATADAIEYVGARPVFVDVEKSTGNIDVNLIEEKITNKSKVILPVHLYGQMVDMTRMKEMADQYRLKIIEDAAHSLEGRREEVRPGQLGDLAAFSFYATKAITCGEGGAIATNNQEAYNWFKKARSHGLNREVAARHHDNFQHYDKEFLGFKANMSNIQAALLINQLDRVEDYLQRKEEICQKYNTAFSKIKDIKLLDVLPQVKHARHLYIILVPALHRDKILAQIKQKGVGAIVNYQPIHLLSYYKNKYGYSEGDFPVAEEIGASTISLPLYPKLTDQEVDYIIEVVSAVLEKY